MVDDITERKQEEPEQDYRPSEHPDTEPPATEETVEKHAQRDQAEGD